MCSTNVPNVRRFTGATRKAGSTVIDAWSMGGFPQELIVQERVGTAEPAAGAGPADRAVLGRVRASGGAGRRASSHPVDSEHEPSGPVPVVAGAWTETAAGDAGSTVSAAAGAADSAPRCRIRAIVGMGVPLARRRGDRARSGRGGRRCHFSPASVTPRTTWRWKSMKTTISGTAPRTEAAICWA
ncbi:hypothetical protein GCM10023405_02160 [Streptomonospora salina]